MRGGCGHKHNPLWSFQKAQVYMDWMRVGACEPADVFSWIPDSLSAAAVSQGGWLALCELAALGISVNNGVVEADVCCVQECRQHSVTWQMHNYLHCWSSRGVPGMLLWQKGFIICTCGGLSRVQGRGSSCPRWLLCTVDTLELLSGWWLVKVCLACRPAILHSQKHHGENP